MAFTRRCTFQNHKKKKKKKKETASTTRNEFNYRESLPQKGIWKLKRNIVNMKVQSNGRIPQKVEKILEK